MRHDLGRKLIRSQISVCFLNAEEHTHFAWNPGGQKVVPRNLFLSSPSLSLYLEFMLNLIYNFNSTQSITA